MKNSFFQFFVSFIIDYPLFNTSDIIVMKDISLCFILKILKILSTT